MLKASPSPAVLLSLILGAAFLGLVGCDTQGDEDDILIRAAYVQDQPSRLHSDLDWTTDGLYTSGLPAILRYDLGPDLRPVSDATLFEWPPATGYAGLTSVSVSADGQAAAAVRGEWGDAIAGALVLVDLGAGTVRELRDSTWNVADARFLETGPLGRPGRVLFYAFGRHPRTGGDVRAGYYVLDPSTGRDSLVLAATSSAGIEAGFHRFDVSPDGRLLVGPDYRGDVRIGLTVADLSATPVAGRAVGVQTALGDRARSLTVRFRPDGRALAYVANVFARYPEFLAERSDIGTVEVGAEDAAEWVATPRVTRPYGDDPFVARTVGFSPDGRSIAYAAASVRTSGPAYAPQASSLFVGPVTP